ncbi:hypothetical protein GCM10017044_26420 [Kordiimonas sediminis]|uniref:diguanylate cyclase n=1 Tax=Kordiimonas sediminis TaxID=1735581 RepID=A0A919EAC3_9PROT|nr:GGDEF domain-containing protein [Kordiimonas sediminis]GHF29842.1 hypothetical protein GCM10017044_26420 [Kordiimonas sediminis]
MINNSALTLNSGQEINPYVSRLASRLMQTAADADVKFDSMGWQLITEVLSFAASAEQRMAEQQHRISYLEQISVTDELTGILNRRGLMLELGRILSYSARHREEGVVGFIDMDGFKDINDTHGHQAGDAVLRHTATILKSRTRSSDVIARIAGDEFCIILTRCDEQQGYARLRKLQTVINTSVLEYGDIIIPLNCSIGVQSFNGATDPERLISEADQAMYMDKKARKTAVA